MSEYLPEEILQEIFLRLPRRSLLRFRCVSKYFCTLIDTPSFRGMHHELSNITSDTSIMFCDGLRDEIFTIDYKSVWSLLPLSTSSTTICDFINLMDHPSIFLECRVEFLSSCNGLVWISRTSGWGKDCYIWNPSSKAYKTIPMAREVEDYNIYVYGFGYDYKTDDYKLIRVVVDWELECSNVDVYTLSSNSWKNTQSIPYLPFYEASTYTGVLFNGALHWLAHTIRKDSIVLVCFDIASEGFKEVALPEAPKPYSEELLEEDMCHINVGVLGECLCLVSRVINVRVDVWIMQNYTVPESWIKSFVITHESITSSTFFGLIWSFKNNETLWEIDGGLIFYEPQNSIYREMMLDSHYSERRTIAENYTVSSVSF